jgi:hypothetical protein
MEKDAFKSLIRVADFYEAATTDEDRLYHLNSGIGILQGLKAFVETKVELEKLSAKKSKKTSVNVEVKLEETEKSDKGESK